MHGSVKQTLQIYHQFKVVCISISFYILWFMKYVNGKLQYIPKQKLILSSSGADMVHKCFTQIFLEDFTVHNPPNKSTQRKKSLTKSPNINS